MQRTRQRGRGKEAAEEKAQVGWGGRAFEEVLVKITYHVVQYSKRNVRVVFCVVRVNRSNRCARYATSYQGLVLYTRAQLRALEELATKTTEEWHWSNHQGISSHSYNGNTSAVSQTISVRQTLTGTSTTSRSPSYVSSTLVGKVRTFPVGKIRSTWASLLVETSLLESCHKTTE